jgi:hypothetical protein
MKTHLVTSVRWVLCLLVLGKATTVGVAYGGTGVTASSGANSVMLRDANQNVAVNRLNQSNTLSQRQAVQQR